MDKYLIHKSKTLETALNMLNTNLGIGLVVVDDTNTILGTVTDGDIRRAITNGIKVSANITEVMFKSPKTVTSKNSPDLETLTKSGRIKLVPIVDGTKVIDVYTVNPDEMKDIPVVLMAGGLGSRLGELTKDTPKPMLHVGGKPVLERIIENFTRVGFKKFFISVNYKAEIIENYFKDGSEFNCEITYLREKKRLGTAGSLSLLPDDISGPFIVTNGDLLTLVDYRTLMSFHKGHNSKITMCTRLFEMQVPYGVVNIKDGVVDHMVEKPTHSFHVNAGVYVLDSSIIKNIKSDEYLDMPTFIESKMSEYEAHCFPMVEKWIDIGKVSDLEYARALYGEDND